MLSRTKYNLQTTIICELSDHKLCQQWNNIFYMDWDNYGRRNVSAYVSSAQQSRSFKIPQHNHYPHPPTTMNYIKGLFPMNFMRAFQKYFVYCRFFHFLRESNSLFLCAKFDLEYFEIQNFCFLISNNVHTPYLIAVKLLVTQYAESLLQGLARQSIWYTIRKAQPI